MVYHWESSSGKCETVCLSANFFFWVKVVYAETLKLSWGNINGVVSSNIYRQKDAPNYRPGHGVVFAYLVLFLFLGSIVTTIGLRVENKKRLSGQRDHWVQGRSESEVMVLGDKRYIMAHSDMCS